MNLIDTETGEVLNQTPNLALASGQFLFTPTGLTVSGEPDFDTWQQVGQQLRYIEAAVHWWIGDWLNYGERRWGEMYTQALEETGFKAQTLANDKWIAGRVDPSRRRDALTFSHHAEVAALSPAAQDRWLDTAEQERLSTRELRQRVKSGNTPPGEFFRVVASFGPDSGIELADLLRRLHQANAPDEAIVNVILGASLTVVITDREATQAELKTRLQEETR